MISTTFDKVAVKGQFVCNGTHRVKLKEFDIMSYVITVYQNGVTPSQEFTRTKAEAVTLFRVTVKECTKVYTKGSGYKKVGTVQSGRIKFEHPAFGVDTLITIQNN